MEASSDYIAHALNVPSTIVRFDKEISLRGLPAEADKLIETELRKRSRQFDITIVAPDPESLEIRFPELTGFMNRMRLKACILKPIRINHERNGFVFVATHSPRAWTSEEIGLVEVASQQIGLSIESIRYHQETQSYADLVKRLTGATSIINRLVPLDELIPMIGQRALQLSNTDKLALILREQDGVVRASWVFGMTKPEFDKAVEKEGKQILEVLAGDINPVSIEKITESPLPQMFKKQLATDGVNSLRLTPIVYSGNIIGAVAAFDEMPVEWLPQQREIMMTFANTASLALQSAWYYEQLEKGYLDLALTLANTIDSRESDAKASSTKIAEWSQRTAKLLGLSNEDQNLVHWAAMLHNIGKVEVPDEVLQKPGPLSAEERKLIEHYPVKSEKLLSPLNRFREVGRALRYIHERFDGKGYPDRKKGEDIPMPARILAVADTYESMIENRPYRQAHSHESALREITKNKGSQFDPVVVDAFLQAVSVQGTTVQ
jgi:HD-GYP domain-containing protein (c-di-GMP phosphodiesterase class II)